MKQAEHSFLLLFAVFLAIFTTGVNSVKCNSNTLLYLDTIPLQLLVVQPMEAKEVMIRFVLSSVRQGPMEFLKRTVLQTFDRSSSFELVQVKQASESCIRYESDLSKYANEEVTEMSNELNTHILLGAAAAVREKFTTPEDSASGSNPPLRVIVIFTETFATSESSEEPNQFTCKSPPPTVKEASEVFQDAKATVIFLSPEENTRQKWDQSFKASDDSVYFPPSLQFPRPSLIINEMSFYVRNKVVERACSDYAGLAVQIPERRCITGSDSVLEVVWLFNPQSKSDDHPRYPERTGATLEKMLDRLKGRFFEVKAGVATYGENLGDGCYTRIQKLTSDLDKAVESLKNQKMYSNYYDRKASFAGVSLALSDPDMGWTTTSTNEKGETVTRNARGQNVFKVVLLLTDGSSSKMPALSGPEPGWGNPNDNCNTINSPMPGELGGILRKADVMLVVFLPIGVKKRLWPDYLKDMEAEGADVAQQILELPDNDPDGSVLDDLVYPIENRLCPFPATGSTTQSSASPSTTPVTTPLPTPVTTTPVTTPSIASVIEPPTIIKPAFLTSTTPMSTPPMSTPPMSTPPMSTPPMSTPPMSTPPTTTNPETKSAVTASATDWASLSQIPPTATKLTSSAVITVGSRSWLFCLVATSACVATSIN